MAVPDPRVTLAPVSQHDLAVRSIAEAYLVRYGNPLTRGGYRADLEGWGRWCQARGIPLLGATRAHVELWLREQEAEGRAPATRARRLAAVAGFYETAVEERFLERSPAARVRRPRLDRDSQTLGLEREQCRALLDAAALAGPREHALICLLLLNGLRISEALGIRPADLSVVQGHQVVTVTRKGGYRARVALPPRTVRAISEVVSSRGGARMDDSLFRAARGGGPLDIFGAGRLVRQLARAAGISSSVHPHMLRHAFVTSALAAGVPLHRVQDAAGHADPRTTMRYNRAMGQLDEHAAYDVARYLE